jgi:hypothetical protein
MLLLLLLSQATPCCANADLMSEWNAGRGEGEMRGLNSEDVKMME